MTDEQRAAIRDILRYIQKQPGAKHTARGIAEYWTFQQRLEEKVDIVLAAIAYLVKEGFLEEIQKEDLQNYYRVNQKKLEDIPRELEILDKEN
ncbi:MAG: hypothetical protein ACE5HS_07920 [bacterium]